MDQFRQLGEVVGSLRALMVLKHEIVVNQRQCSLLFDMFELAFETISDEIRKNLRLDEKNTKWKPLEYPLKELHRVFKEGEIYIKNCMDMKDLWGKAVSLYFNRDCVEFHIHNLLCCFPVVVEAIETVAEYSGSDLEEMQNRRNALMKKYDSECDSPKLFQWMHGRQYLVSREICARLDSAGKEDRWALLDTLSERKRNSLPTTPGKHEHKLRDFLMNRLNCSNTFPQKPKFLPSSALLGANDFSVKRRLGLGEGHVKEIQWLGESFALRTFFGEMEPLNQEIALVFSLSHPNILQYLCGFYDEERKEGSLLMELMNKNLKTYIKENSGQRKRLPFSIPVAVDIMLQIARALEYLHSKKVYHGELNPSNILLKTRYSSSETYFQVKLSGFGLISIKSYAKSPYSAEDPVIWYAPEVLAEQEQFSKKCNAKYSEKADVYSFGMLCFELLTGKVPFEDSHLQGDKMVRNIRAGERPLFPYPAPKYLANLTRKCWHPNPSLRPSFSAICRILRYIKKFLMINPDHGLPESLPPLVDYCDIEASYSKKYCKQENGPTTSEIAPISQIPFQLYSYRIVQKQKALENDRTWEMGTPELPKRPASVSGEEHLAALDDIFVAPASDGRSVCSEIIESTNIIILHENPRRRSLLTVSADHPHRQIKPPEASSLFNQRKGNAENTEKEKPPSSSSSVAESESKSKNAETQVPEKTATHDASKTELKPTLATVPRKAPSKKLAHRRKLSEIPEKGISASLMKKPAKNSEKKYHPVSKAGNSEKKISPSKKPKETSTPKPQGTSKDKVPWDSSPSSAKMSRSVSTRGPMLSLAVPSKGYMSAQSSPLHPSFRSSKPSTMMSPQR